jgi:ribosomal protein S18 acetylase RimI-like enzyme
VTDSFRIEVLATAHERAAFTSGSEPLDRYFRQQVSQDVRRRATACYVAVDSNTGKVAGYFTLAASGIPLIDLPAVLVQRLPRYPLVPVALLGRLAVDQKYRGHKLGAALLWDAAQRAARAEAIVFALVVDAKDDEAEAFYKHHGFLTLAVPRKLVLPVASFVEKR